MVNNDPLGTAQPTNCQMRRATVDDLVALRRLWQQLGWPVDNLEKRLGDFQIVETPDGQVLGAVGLQIEAQHGRLHAEAFQSPQLAEQLRPRLWERVRSVARNHGLFRLWIEAGSSLFWLEQGFEVAGSELLRKMPTAFGQGDGQRWLSLQLRDEAGSAVCLDKEFEFFRQSQRAESERLMARAKWMKAVAGFVALVLFILVGCAAWYVVRRMHGHSGH